ncbi:MAG: hypothetical protein WCO53_09370 [Deltaproteobacteria bacterium]
MDYYLHDDARLPLAWAPWFSHEYITYFSVQAIDWLMALPPTRVKQNQNFTNQNWPIGPKHIDLYKESYKEYRELSPLWSFSYGERNGKYSVEPPENETIEPWKILVIYTTEPDLHPDCDLDLNKNQKITGGSHGWRHMQFRALGRKFGMATESVRVHIDLASMAFNSGNDYWGWRYLSRATHYLADLGNPFHVRAAPSWFLIKNLFASKKIFQIVSTAHQGYEIYVERRFREGFPAFKQALLKGAREGQTVHFDMAAEISSYRHQAEKRLKPIFHFILDQFGQELIDIFGKLDKNSHLDAATQTNMCSKDAAEIIFRDPHLPALDFLDRITAEILFDVGRMLGALLNNLSSAYPKR